jgi:hypothetical protein
VLSGSVDREQRAIRSRGGAGAPRGCRGADRSDRGHVPFGSQDGTIDVSPESTLWPLPE